MRERTVSAAIGRWREILPALGVERKFLGKRNGPCPICGGKDRFRFTDRYKKGDYFCNQCGAGQGLKLVMRANGWDFKTACKAVDDLIGNREVKMDRAHMAARKFFDSQPDRQEIRDKARLNILMDENIPFDTAMELMEIFPRKVA